MKLYRNQKGFGLIEGLLLVIALTLVFGVGYYVYSQNNKKNENRQDAAAAEQSQNDGQTAAKQKTEYFEIKELGVKVMPGKELSNIKYRYETFDDGGGAAYFYTDDLIQKSKNCNEPANFYPDQVTYIAFSKNNGKFSSKKYPLSILSKQFNNFFLAYSLPNGIACNPDKKSQAEDYHKLSDSLQKQTIELFKHAEEL